MIASVMRERLAKFAQQRVSWLEVLSCDEYEGVMALAVNDGFDDADDMEAAYRLNITDAGEWHKLQSEHDENEQQETLSYHQSLGV